MLARLHAELSRCMYSEHGLLALMRPVFGAVLPAVDGGVVLHARVSAFPGGVGDLAHQVPRLQGAHGLAGVDRRELPVLVFLDGAHELVGDPHRVVGVLVLDRVRIDSVEVHVEAGVTQRARLALFACLAPDELSTSGVVDVEDDHLGGPPGLPAALDGPG